MSDDRISEYARGPDPNSDVPVVPPERPAPKRMGEFYARLACQELRDAGLKLGPCRHDHSEEVE